MDTYSTIHVGTFTCRENMYQLPECVNMFIFPVVCVSEPCLAEFLHQNELDLSV